MKDWLDEEMEREGLAGRSEYDRRREENAVMGEASRYGWFGSGNSMFESRKDSAAALKREHAAAHKRAYSAEAAYHASHTKDTIRTAASRMSNSMQDQDGPRPRKKQNTSAAAIAFLIVGAWMFISFLSVFIESFS